MVGYANARVKKRHARELSRNQPILRLDVILQHDWPIEQCLFDSGGKTKRPCFDLLIHWLMYKRSNEHLPKPFFKVIRKLLHVRFEIINRELKQQRFCATRVKQSGLFAHLSCDFEQKFGQIISTRVKTVSNTNLVASRHIKREKGSLPVDVRRSKKVLLKLPTEVKQQHCP